MQVNWVESADSHVISVADRGYQYGDGLFETMAVVDGKLPFWQWHVERLQEGCRRLRLTCPSLPSLAADISSRIANIQRAVLKLILSRGDGGRGYAIATHARSNLVLQLHPWPDLPTSYWTHGVKCRFCHLQLARQPALAGLKHLNRLEQVLARSEWTDPGIQEGLLADTGGNIIEAVSHNLFIVRGDSIQTPALDQSGVAGVMRQYVLELLKQQGRDVEITSLDRHALLAADAVFLCNSIHGIWPVCELESRLYGENGLVSALCEEVARLLPYC